MTKNREHAVETEFVQGVVSTCLLHQSRGCGHSVP